MSFWCSWAVPVSAEKPSLLIRESEDSALHIPSFGKAQAAVSLATRNGFQWKLHSSIWPQLPPRAQSPWTGFWTHTPWVWRGPVSPTPTLLIFRGSLDLWTPSGKAQALNSHLSSLSILFLSLLFYLLNKKSSMKTKADFFLTLVPTTSSN